MGRHEDDRTRPNETYMCPSRDDTENVVPVKRLNPANFTHPYILSNDHIDSFQVFIDDVNRALAGALSSSGSFYKEVSVLFLRWEDDVFIEPGVNNGVQGEIDNLEQVLMHDYGFKTELYLIPSHNAQRCLQKRIYLLQEEHDSRDELLLVYYGGHGVLNDMNQSIWAQGDGPTVDWFSIQHMLEYAVPDVVILLDCCYAASADLRSVDGTLEVLAACGREVTTVGISDWSFTSRLTELLRDLKDQAFTIVQLHSKLMNYRAVDGPKKLLKTPHHGIMSNKDKASIRLSAMTTPLDVMSVDKTELATSTVGVVSPRVLIAVSLKKNDHDPGVWRDWLLSHLPGGVDGLSLVRPEGIWGAHSVLGLFSLPAAVWDLLPNRFSYTFVGFVTTPNMIGRAIDTADTRDINFVAQALADPEMRLLELPEAKERSSSSELPAVTMIKSEDIVIAVMGLTGAGKSNFIATASAKELKIGHTLQSTTQQVEFASFQYKGKNVHLIDTPGFDDTFRSDANVLQEIAYWLCSAYGSNVQLSGIIYLHPISFARMTGSAVRQLQVMQKTWGTSMLPSVAMVTTMWDITDLEIGAARERELKSKFWLPFLEQGSFYRRFDNSRNSALSIIETFITKVRGTLQIQHEMVDRHKRLIDTEAGQELSIQSNQLILKLERQLDSVNDLACEDKRPAGLDWALDKSRVELEAQIANMRASTAALQVDIAEVLAVKHKELQERLEERERGLIQTQYNDQSKRLLGLMWSKRYLQQTLSTGTIAASTAVACVVM